MVRYEIRDGVGHIILSNPPLNTFTDPEFTDKEQLQSFFRSDRIRCAVVRGEGRHFCGGADLDALRKQAVDAGVFFRKLAQGKVLLECIRSAPVPVAAAVRGSCLGAGLELALACHFRFVADSAMLGFPEVEHRLLPGLGGTLAAGEGITRAVLTELVLSGRMVRGSEAVALGLAHACHPPGGVESASVDFLNGLTAQRPLHLIHAAMTALNNARVLPRERALEEETRLFCELARNPL